MSSHELANNSVGCGTALSLPCDLFSQILVRNFFSKYVSSWEFIDVSKHGLSNPLMSGDNKKVITHT